MKDWETLEQLQKVRKLMQPCRDQGLGGERASRFSERSHKQAKECGISTLEC